MEYENLIKECFDTFIIQPTSKYSKMKTKILKKFYEESLREEYKEYNFFEDLIKYTLKTNKNNKHGLVALIRVEEEKVYDEVQKDLLKDEIQLIKLAIKNCDIETIINLTKNNNIDLSDCILLLKKGNPDLLLSDNENNIKNLDFKNYPWVNLQNKSKLNKKYITNKIGVQSIYKNDKMGGYIIKGNLIEIKKFFNTVESFSEKDYYLNLAARFNQTNIVEYLLNEGVNPSEYAVIQAMKNKNYAMFKSLVIHGVRDEKWMDYKCDDFCKREITAFIEKEKIIEMQEKLNFLQEKYLKNKKLNIKKIPNKKSSAFLNIFSLEVENLNIDNEEVIFEENLPRPKEKIKSPFDILINGKLDLKSIPKKIKEVKIEKNTLFISKEKIINSEMQKKWDKDLILAFSNDVNISMYVLIERFKEKNKEEWHKFKVDGFDLKRFPHSSHKLQWSLTPFRFVCKYLPEMRDILLNGTLSDIKNNIDKFTDKINNTNIDTNRFDIKKSTIKSESEEFKENQKILSKARLNRAMYEYNKEEYSNHNWKKVK